MCHQKVLSKKHPTICLYEEINHYIYFFHRIFAVSAGPDCCNKRQSSIEPLCRWSLLYYRKEDYYEIDFGRFSLPSFDEPIICRVRKEQDFVIYRKGF